VFHQQVDVGVPAVQRRGEQQVRVPPLQRLVDKARRHRGQPPQVYPGRQVRRQDGPQLGRGVLGHAEDPAEHRVVRRGLIRHNRTVTRATDIPSRSELAQRAKAQRMCNENAKGHRTDRRNCRSEA
jgi:hypothetical protein